MNPDTSVIYALDFDGVICDSVGESSLSAFKSAKKKWPDLQFPYTSTGEPARWMMDAMREVRPVIETGYENVLLARLLTETSQVHVRRNFIEPVLEEWQELRDQLMEKWGVEKEQLVKLFGDVRDDWIDNRLDSWIGANRIFPGVVDALNFTSADVYIITTKQTRFCKLLLHKYGITSVPEDRIFGYGSGSKISVLKKLLAIPENAGRDVCFVEDRYETLEAVSLSMLGQPLQLYLATWGYNTEKTRKTAEMHPFISLIDLNTFVSKFQ